MADEKTLAKIIDHVYDCEARLDKKGRLQVYTPPQGDGGGTFEVCGITERWNRNIATYLKNLIDQGNHAKATSEAKRYIGLLSDTPIILWGIQNDALEAEIRDTCFHRGLPGVTKILQLALNVDPDGRLGPITKRALAEALKDPKDLLVKISKAREVFEHRFANRDESSSLWGGLVNRWNKTLAFAETLLEE